MIIDFKLLMEVNQKHKLRQNGDYKNVNNHKNILLKVHKGKQIKLKRI